MLRHDFAKWIGVVTVALFAPAMSRSAAADAATGRPNVLLIVGDDMGYADVGFHGCKDIPTPHLDALAKSGVRFTSGYVSGPYCSPTRAGLLTGRYQQRFGHEFNAGGDESGLPISERTLADRLKAAGYVTAAVGKWHLGSAPQFHPQRRGFDEFFGFLGGANAYLPQEPGGTVPNIRRNEKPADEREYLTDALAREAVSFVERKSERPWLLYLAFNAVHTPLHADDARLKKFAGIADERRQKYAAMMSAMDDAIGRVLAAVRAAGEEGNTLVVFHSDNGGPTMASTSVNGASNAPLRGSKRQTLEGGVRVPFLMSWRNQLPAGQVFEQPVIQLDVFPTALAAVGIEVGPDAKPDGVNLLPYLRGEASVAPHEALFWRFGEQMAIRRGNLKLVRYGENTTLIPGETWPKLYDLSQDIGEERDVAAERPQEVRELQAAWDAWNRGNIAPLWGGARPDGPGRARRRAAKREAAQGVELTPASAQPSEPGGARRRGAGT